MHQTVLHKWDKYDLRSRLKENIYKKDNTATNNFLQTMPIINARKAVGMFKDEYLLDYINVEEIEIDKFEDIDERIVESSIISNIKKFIMTFGRDFAFIGNQYNSPMGVATYKTTSDMDEKTRNSLPDIEELKKLL